MLEEECLAAPLIEPHCNSHETFHFHGRNDASVRAGADQL